MFTPGNENSINFDKEGEGGANHNTYVSLMNEILMGLLLSILQVLIVVVVGILQDQLVGPSFQCKINK